MMKIVLLGGSDRALNTFKAILTKKIPNLEISLCIFMRGHQEEHAACASMVTLAADHLIPYTVSETITPCIIQKLQEINPIAMVCLGVWRSLISDEALQACQNGYIGLHGTPLPRLRGFAGIYWQIINGEKNITTRFFQLDAGIDSGPYVCDELGNILEYKISIDNEKHLQEIFIDYEEMHINATLDLIERLQNNLFSFLPQPQESATYACHRGPEDAEINWEDTTKNVFNFIRAQSYPASGAFTYCHDTKIIIQRAKPRYDYQNYEGRITGKVVTRDFKTGNVVILTKDSGIEILECTINEIYTQPIKAFKSIRIRCQSALEAKINHLLAHKA